MRRRPTCKNGFLPFSEARDVVRSMGFASSVTFKVWAFTEERPENIPVAPENVYEKEWKDWDDFLGRSKYVRPRRRRPSKDIIYMSYEDAAKIIRPLNLKSVNEFKVWASSDERPENFPSNPDVYYGADWTGYRDFLGKQEVEFISLKTYKGLVKPIGLKTEADFRKWSKTKERPHNAPSNPDKYYKTEWKGWPDFLQKNT